MNNYTGKNFFWQIWSRSGDPDELGPCHGNLEGGKVVDMLILCRSGITVLLAIEIQIDLLFFFFPLQHLILFLD